MILEMKKSSYKEITEMAYNWGFLSYDFWEQYDSLDELYTDLLPVFATNPNGIQKVYVVDDNNEKIYFIEM